jgi:hypothetical protein
MAQITPFPGAVEAERRLAVKRADPSTQRLAENLLIAALFNYRQVTTGESDDIVSYAEVPDVLREYWYRLWAVPMAMQAIWRDNEEQD